MIEKLSMRVAPEIAYVPLRLQAAVSTRLGLDVNRIKDVRIRKRSIDARQRNVVINLTLEVFIDEYPDPANETIAPMPFASVSESREGIVVGAGPAGLFGALRLIELGLKPVVLERGKSVDERGR
ncbi:MAG: NAD(P)/FAD-dependent oxidoreductase, partial [Muribaculaceae bacterium]|nr:NAD(P)/FAD-dependent oxidoreductase [Muribaculaceae bacterium]